MTLFKFKAEVEIWVIASDKEAAEESLNNAENLLEYAVAYRFSKPESVPFP